MSKIRADVNNLNEAARLFESASSDIDSLVKKLEDVAVELEDSWKGAASIEYINRLRRQIKNLKSIKTPLKEVAGQCTRSAKELKVYDDLINTIFKGLNAMLRFRKW